MVKLANTLSLLKPAKILVIGDMLLDAYTIGKARRISPEAPVAIVNVQREEYRPGGAGNVILNLISLGAEVCAIGRIGNDWAADLFKQSLKEENIETNLIFSQRNYSTPVKNRIIADNQQIVRIDHEQIIPLDPDLESIIIDHLPQAIDGVKMVAISDYGKGFLSDRLLASLIKLSNEKGIPVITDPKGHHFAKYKGTTIIKPNLSEAFAAAKLPMTAPLDEAAASVLAQTEAQMLMVTRSEAGISLFDDDGGRFDFPVQAKEVKDVTGAGDTVLAMLSYALANQLSYGEAAQLCNVAAGIAIEHVGCARITLSELAFRLFENNRGQKVFDQEHLFVLQEILKQKPYRLLILPQLEQLTPSLYQSIKNVSEEGDSLLIYIDEIEPKEPFIEMISSLQEVSFIVLHLDSLKDLCQCSNPKATYLYDSHHGKIMPGYFAPVLARGSDGDETTFSMGKTTPG